MRTSFGEGDALMVSRQELFVEWGRLDARLRELDGPLFDAVGQYHKLMCTDNQLSGVCEYWEFESADAFSDQTSHHAHWVFRYEGSKGRAVRVLGELEHEKFLRLVQEFLLVD